ncbi:uncharacterized protein [Miscanthus floridulus]|uniref:uncharacterized protein n=1 Tax=Miscanthus floridulus TaxID=154761 RepID=UPI003457901B
MEQQPQPSSSATTTSSSSQQRRELQGPRPAPLKVRKDSHKIKKPPPPQPGGEGGPVQQVRQPVIIYTVSPKVVHAEPSEFMSVVQRLTGARGTTASSSSLPVLVPPPPGATTTEPHHHHHQVQMTSSSLPIPFPFLGGHQYVHAPSSSSSAQLLPPAAPHFPFQLQQQQQALGVAVPYDHLMVQPSPAARLAIEQQVAAAAAARSSGGTAASDVVGGSLLPPFPSILSPGSLPAIPPSFFSPPTPAGNSYPGISLFGGLTSPAFLGNETTGGGSMNIASIAGASHQSVTMSSSLQEASPSTVTPSPSAGAYYWDLFNNQQH